jgi:Fe-S cluster assembly protein SufD
MSKLLRRKEDYVGGFEAFLAARPAEPAWLATKRQNAIARFADLGFPTARHEDWRWTNLKALTKLGLVRPDVVSLTGIDRSTVAPFTFDDLDAHRLVFVNSHFAAELSTVGDLPAGSIVGSLAASLAENADSLEPHLGRIANAQERAFPALNTAYFTDGAYIEIPAGVTVKAPIHIIHLTTAGAEPIVTLPRGLVVVGEGSTVRILETHGALGSGAYLAAPVTEVVVSDRANLVFESFVKASDAALQVSTQAVRQGTETSYRGGVYTLSGAVVRNEHHVGLHGEHTRSEVNGLGLGHGSQVIDNYTRFDHAVPHCESHQLFKGILTDESTGNFDGKILVRQDAQKTDAKQTSRNLILSDKAIANNKPQLEIYADDVKCTHGATTGRLDPEAIFYLKARGLDADQARSLLTYAFAREVVDLLDIDAVRAEIDQAFLRQLPGGEAILESQ